MLLGVLDYSVKSEGEVDRQIDLGTIWGGRKFDSGPDFHPRGVEFGLFFFSVIEVQN